MNEIVNIVQELSALLDDKNGGLISVRVDRIGNPSVHVRPQWFVDNFNNFKVTDFMSNLPEDEYTAKYQVRTETGGVEFISLLTKKEHTELILKSELITEGLA